MRAVCLSLSDVILNSVQAVVLCLLVQYYSGKFSGYCEGVRGSSSVIAQTNSFEPLGVSLCFNRFECFKWLFLFLCLGFWARYRWLATGVSGRYVVLGH